MGSTKLILGPLYVKGTLVIFVPNQEWKKETSLFHIYYKYKTQEVILPPHPRLNPHTQQKGPSLKVSHVDECYNTMLEFSRRLQYSETRHSNVFLEHVMPLSSYQHVTTNKTL
jgi:hypothetical protein